MRVIMCAHDGKLCDLNKHRHLCRHLRTWAGKCYSRVPRVIKREEVSKYEASEHDKNKAAQERDRRDNLIRSQ